MKLGNKVRFNSNGSPDFTFGWPLQKSKGFLKMADGEVGEIVEIDNNRVAIHLPDHKNSAGDAEPQTVAVNILYFLNPPIPRWVELITETMPS